MMLWSFAWSEQERELYAIGRDDTERHGFITRLKAQRAQLEGANQDLLAFARAVSHDLRAPLAAVIGFVGRVLETDGRGLSERSQFLLQRAHAAGTRMDASMVSLLRLTRVAEAGVHRRACDITAMCLEVGAALADATPARSVTLSVQPGMTGRADKELLRHVVENLLSNAWKFTSGRAQAHIQVGALSNSCEPIFFVKDDGAGFDMQDAGKLFVPFSRLHDRSSFEGTGIGLSIVQRVVHAHGGRVWVEAEQGEGAVFYFTLGLCGDCVKPAPPGPEPTAAPRILEQDSATVAAALE